jgi:hypothetical protein
MDRRGRVGPEGGMRSGHGIAEADAPGGGRT